MLALFADNEELKKEFEKTKPPPPLSPEDKVRQADGILEAEAVLDLVWNPDRYAEKLCKECNRPFVTNRPKFVSLCSVPCMKKTLEAVGLDWDPLRPLTDRWRRMRKYPDMIVPPEALEHLRSLLLPNPDESEPLSEEGPHNQASSA